MTTSGASELRRDFGWSVGINNVLPNTAVEPVSFKKPSSVTSAISSRSVLHAAMLIRLAISVITAAVDKNRREICSAVCSMSGWCLGGWSWYSPKRFFFTGINRHVVKWSIKQFRWNSCVNKCRKWKEHLGENNFTIPGLLRLEATVLSFECVVVLFWV